MYNARVTCGQVSLETNPLIFKLFCLFCHTNTEKRWSHGTPEKMMPNERAAAPVPGIHLGRRAVLLPEPGQDQGSRTLARLRPDDAVLGEEGTARAGSTPPATTRRSRPSRFPHRPRLLILLTQLWAMRSGRTR